jgi:hypothetical protein
MKSRGTPGPARALFARGTYGTYELAYIADTSSATHPTEGASDYVFIIYDDGGAELGYWSESYFGFEARFDCGGWTNILTGDGQNLTVDRPETVLEFGEVVDAVCPSADLAESRLGKV